MSTGKPLRTPTDVQRVKNEYLEYIRKEAELEDRNLQINKQYLETGMLPASSQMIDTRSNAEKLADIEGLKNKIANDLSPIAEPMFARNIVNKVINSRLNINGKLLRYLAQNAPQIAEQLKKKYSIGIAGDMNDVDIIVNFIESLFTETQGTMQSVQDYAKATTNQTNQKSNVLNVNDIDTMIMNLQDMIKRLQISGKKIGQPVYSKINEITSLLSFIKNGLPSQELLNEMIKNLDSNILRQNDPDDDADEMKLLFKILESIPKPNIVFTQIDILNKIIDNKYDNEVSRNAKINEALNKIIDQFSDFLNEENVRIITRFINKWKQPTSREIKQAQEQTAKMEAEQERERERYINNAKKVYVVNPEDDAVWVRNARQTGSNIPPPPFPPNEQLPNIPQQTNQNQFFNFENFPPLYNGIRNLFTDLPQQPRRRRQTQPQPQPIPELPEELRGLPPVPPIQPNPQPNPQPPRSQGIENINVDSLPQKQQDEFLNRYLGRLRDEQVKEYIIVATNHNPHFRDFVDRWITEKNRVEGRRNPNAPIITIDNASKRQLVRLLLDYKNHERRDIGVQGFGVDKLKRGRKPSKKVILGKGIINQETYDKGILSMTRSNGSRYADLPSFRMTSKFKNIMNDIIGGKMPNFNDLSRLDEKEVEYLKKICKKADIDDRLSIPAPSKDKEEKDIHEFEVMRGQIMSGNDNKDLVKKFKVLIMRLSRQGLLPKNETQEVLEELINLGY